MFAQASRYVYNARGSPDAKSQILQIARARVGCFAQQEHALFRILDEWLNGVFAEIGI